MAYTPYYPGGWQSGESGGTPITPAALNNMENGIGAVYTAFHDLLKYEDIIVTTDSTGNAALSTTHANIGNCYKIKCSLDGIIYP